MKSESEIREKMEELRMEHFKHTTEGLGSIEERELNAVLYILQWVME